MDGPPLTARYGRPIVDCLPKNVENTAEEAVAHRNLDGCAGIDNNGITFQPLGVVECDAADRIVREMGLNFEDDFLAGTGGQPVVNGRQMGVRKADVDDASPDGEDRALMRHGSYPRSGLFMQIFSLCSGRESLMLATIFSTTWRTSARHHRPLGLVRVQWQPPFCFSRIILSRIVERPSWSRQSCSMASLV